MTPKYIYDLDNPLFDHLTNRDEILTTATDESIERAAAKGINPTNFTWKAEYTPGLTITVTATPDHENHMPLNRYSPYIAPRLYAAIEIIRRKYAYTSESFMLDAIPHHISKHLPTLINCDLVIMHRIGAGRFERQEWKIIEQPYNDPATTNPKNARTSELFQCDYCGTMQRATTIPNDEHDGFYYFTTCLVCNTATHDYTGADY